MPLSIDWATKIISVPKDYLNLIQSTPTEIRELPINQFRLDLKAIEASFPGMAYLKTHDHNTEVLLGGIVYARVVEILEPYTITFEDGQYAVNLTGANSNIGDRVNLNQVSVRSANSAGLISTATVEFSSFNGGVTIDAVNGVSGTVFPIGTPQQPVNNLADAKLICNARGLNTLFVNGDLTIDNTAAWTETSFIGASPNKTVITIDANADVLNCEFRDASITGTLDGRSDIRDCLVNNLIFLDGFIGDSGIGDIQLGTGTQSDIFQSYSTIAGTTTPEIDLNNVGVIALRDYNGGVKLINYSGSSGHSIDLASGQVILDSASITSGTFVVRGVGKLVDENGTEILTGTWNGGVTIINELVRTYDIPDRVWNKVLP